MKKKLRKEVHEMGNALAILFGNMDMLNYKLEENTSQQELEELQSKLRDNSTRAAESFAKIKDIINAG